MIQSKVYQKDYQETIRAQVDGVLDKMKVSQFATISAYLDECYNDGFIGTMFDLFGQNVPLFMPINQESMIRAVQLDSKISKGLYTRLGEDVDILKKKITAQVSRGISTNMTYSQVAQQLAGQTRIGYNNSIRIARTEGHRIQCAASMDACYGAKEKGADVVKQWDATLDARTRESHARIDGEIRELEKKFSNGLMYPGDPSGGAAEVVNCRCALLQRARWALDEEELETLKERAEYYGLDKSDQFDDFKKNYLKAVQQTGGKFTIGDAEWELRRTDEARTAYDLIRKADDIAAVSKSSGMSIEDIRTVKNHIFFDTHIKYDGEIERFDADYDMAVAWNRLAAGNPESRDFLLLKHELLENQFEREYNISASEAHEMANAVYPWDKKLFEELGEGGEKDGLL